LEPAIGEYSTRETVVKSTQFKNDIYFSFKCYINNQDEIAARIQNRDQLNISDDIISIILDTFQDNRTALLFQVNPLGTLTDAKISDDGNDVDYLWDTEWEAKTSMTEKYWIAEIRIPLKSIQYKPDATTWGCNFSRTIRANQEIAWWTPVTENNRVSQNGNLNNIQQSKVQNHSLELFPYGTLRYENSDITNVYDELNGDAGIDLQYKYSSNLKANISINPDFATIEGDKEQINLTPWELRFPEKRLFFQDGNDMFGTRIQTFYSRRIGDMKYGGKMIGKVGNNQFNLLIAQTKENTEAFIPEARYTAFKIKRDILKSSTIGFTYTDKMTDTTASHIFSMDYVMNLGKTWKLTGQYVASDLDDIKSHSAWFVRFARENNAYHYHLRYTNIGDDFKENINETGFIRDDDRHELDGDIFYKIWLNNNFKYVSLFGMNNVYWSQNGSLRSWYLTYGSRLYLNNRISFDMSYNNEYKLLNNEYYNNYYKFKVGYNTDEASNAVISYRFGENYARDFKLIEFDTEFQLLKKLSVNYELNHITYSPDPDTQSTMLNILGLSYYFTNDFWLRIFAQNNTQNDKLYFYGLFGWRFKPPFGAIYLIVNSDNYQDFNNNTDIRSEIVFIKLTYPISVF